MFRQCWSNIVSFVLAATTGVVIFAAPAQADTVGWPQDISAVESDYIQSTPSGGVVAANCSNAQTAIRVFAASGALSSNIPQRTDGSFTKSCYSRGTIGKDGTVFGVAEDNHTKFAVVAYRGNTLLWEKRFPHYCSNLGRAVERVVSEMVVGTDGFLYITTLTHQCFAGHYLNKLNPNTGQVVFEKKVSNYTTSFLGASSKGLVSQDSGGMIRYFGYSGSDFAPAVAAVGWVNSIDMNARAFTTNLEYANGACANDYRTTSFRMYRPGSTPFTFSVPACWRLQYVQATSQNGAAALAYNQDGKPTLLSYTPSSSGFTARSITLEDTQDYRSFKTLDAYTSYLPAYVQTDINGNILLVREYNWQRGDTTLTGWQFTLHASNLNVVSEYDTNAFDFQQTERFARGMHWAMAKDRLYIAIGYCTSADPYQCGDHSVKLYAARLARLSMDYPRGSVLGVAPASITCKPVHFCGRARFG